LANHRLVIILSSKRKHITLAHWWVLFSVHIHWTKFYFQYSIALIEILFSLWPQS